MNPFNNGTSKAIVLALAGVLVMAGAVKMALWGVASVEEIRHPPPPDPFRYSLYPSPVRTPAGVVCSELAALRKNQAPVLNSGVATLYNFMEPTMQERVGAFGNLRNAFPSSPYADLFTTNQSTLGPLLVQSNLARQAVTITGPDRTRVVYVFTMARQEEGPYRDCWMTRDITRIEP